MRDKDIRIRVLLGATEQLQDDLYLPLHSSTGPSIAHSCLVPLRPARLHIALILPVYPCRSAPLNDSLSEQEQYREFSAYSGVIKQEWCVGLVLWGCEGRFKALDGGGRRRERII
ncbi:hypothetical protein AOLI_G00002380 [Acnodon oligacanthus]